MIFNTENYQQFTIIIICISFLISILLLLIIKPIWIKEVNKATGSETIYIPLLLLYSFLFSILIGILTFIILYKNNTKTTNFSSIYGV